MNLISKRRHELSSAPGVVITMRALTEKQRISLVLESADTEAKLADLQEKKRALLSQIESQIAEAKAAVEAKSEGAEKLTQDLVRNPVSQALVRVHVESAFLQRTIDEALLRATLTKIEGLRIDGEESAVDGFIEYAPEASFAEAVALANQGAGMSEEERGNSGSPTTSAA